MLTLAHWAELFAWLFRRLLLLCCHRLHHVGEGAVEVLIVALFDLFDVHNDLFDGLGKIYGGEARFAFSCIFDYFNIR